METKTEEFINCDSNLWAVEIAVEFTERWKHIKHKKEHGTKKFFVLKSLAHWANEYWFKFVHQVKNSKKCVM